MDSEYISEWFRFGDMDLDTAELLLSHRPQHLEIICYHCQQAAEKYLKGYLSSRGVEEIPKTHNLIQLCILCASEDKRFTETMEHCSFLTPFGVQPRYPEEIYIEDRHMKKALDCARQIKAFAPLQEVREKLLEEDQEETP